MKLREQQQQTLTALRRERSSWDAHWKDLQQFILPRRGRFLDTDQNKGNKKNTNIIDNTGTLAARTLASGMMAGITSPARPWFRLAPPDPDMRDFAPVRQWLDIVERILREVFARSNFYNAMHTNYGELGTFGTGPIMIQEDYEDVIRVFQFTIGSYFLGLDDRLKANTLYREIPMTVGQIAKQFGTDSMTMGTRQLYDKKQYHEWITVYHGIEPNDDRDLTRADSEMLPVRSVYWEKGADDEQYLRKSGFEEFPIMAPRWDVLGTDVYGRSPGMDALGDVRQLQTEQKEKGKAIAKQVNPPMVGISSLKNKPTNTLPGGVTFVAPTERGAGFAPAYQVNIDINHLKEDIYETQQRIRRAFYEDLFMMLTQTDRREITAREIEERHEEKLLMLGPVMERLNDELLDPAIDRTFNICLRAGIIPEPPQELQGSDLSVEYISIMAQAQKMVGTTGLERLAGFAGQLALGQANANKAPTALDKINEDQMIDEYSEMLGTPAGVVRSDEDVEAMRAEQQQKQQMQENIVNAQQAAEVAATASDVKVGKGNIIDQVLGPVPGGGK
jgi:hypothetical protein